MLVQENKLSADCAYRIPDHVEFLRWDGGDEWVVYHSGTGETLRLSDGAVAILDLLQHSGPLGPTALAQALTGMMEVAPAVENVAEATAALVRALMQHECIEQVPCA